MNVVVTSATRTAESLAASPAAIFVLTTDDIRRGGFATLPEALRMVPGLYVTQINSHFWQVSARGFSDLNNNKMLVLVDGRSVYSPLYGGVYWDTLDLPLEDIERIEVIRGPGGSLWGSNAINGVINIVTKTAEQTQGILVSTSADVQQGDVATVQYGGRVGSNLAYRAFGRSNYWEPFNSPSGEQMPGNFNLTQGGMRIDWQGTQRDGITLEASTFEGHERYLQFLSTLPASALLKGSSVQASWHRVISERSKIGLMGYCDWYTRQDVAAEMRNTCASEFQHSYNFTDRQSLVWGASLRSTGDDLSKTPIPVSPFRYRDTVASGFAQYSIDVLPNRLRAIGGIKFEHNGYTGFEFQPQVRAVWTPHRSHTIWMAVSRAVRTPARDEDAVHFTFPEGTVGDLPLLMQFNGSATLQSEILRAYEVGYRLEPASNLSLDMALYYNDYPNLIMWGAGELVFNPDSVVNTFTFGNDHRAQTHGAELSVRWRPIPRWVIIPSLTELRGSPIAAETNPRHGFNLQSRFDLPYRLEFDSSYYHYSGLPLLFTPANPLTISESINRLNRVDVGFSWHATPQLTFAVWGRNLQADRHRESLDSWVAPSGEIPRSVVFKLSWTSKAESGN